MFPLEKPKEKRTFEREGEGSKHLHLFAREENAWIPEFTDGNSTTGHLPKHHFIYNTHLVTQHQPYSCKIGSKFFTSRLTAVWIDCFWNKENLAWELLLSECAIVMKSNPHWAPFVSGILQTLPHFILMTTATVGNHYCHLPNEEDEVQQGQINSPLTHLGSGRAGNWTKSGWLQKSPQDTTQDLINGEWGVVQVLHKKFTHFSH